MELLAKLVQRRAGDAAVYVKAHAHPRVHTMVRYVPLILDTPFFCFFFFLPLLPFLLLLGVAAAALTHNSANASFLESPVVPGTWSTFWLAQGNAALCAGMLKDFIVYKQEISVSGLFLFYNIFCPFSLHLTGWVMRACFGNGQQADLECVLMISFASALVPLLYTVPLVCVWVFVTQRSTLTVERRNNIHAPAATCLNR